jgi:hypothetical protein
MQERQEASPEAIAWTSAPAVTLCEKQRPLFPAIPAEPGIYKLKIGDRVYIGTSKNLRRRLNEYRNTTDDLDENFRRRLIQDARTAELWYYINPEMADDRARHTWERRAISEAAASGHKLLNKGSTRDVNYLQFRVDFLQLQLEQAQRALDAAEHGAP